jgi:hypothetical protein
MEVIVPVQSARPHLGSVGTQLPFHDVRVRDPGIDYIERRVRRARYTKCCDQSRPAS